jgi:hypothetical protein
MTLTFHTLLDARVASAVAAFVRSHDYARRCLTATAS